MEKLSDNECLVVTGFERFSKYTGYASTFKFDGNFDDATEIDSTSLHRKTCLVAIDALKFNDDLQQYEQDNIVRELNKASVGFHESM